MAVTIQHNMTRIKDVTPIFRDAQNMYVLRFFTSKRTEIAQA